MWSEGDVVARREVLNDGRCWLEVPVVVVQDNDELLATYIASGAAFTFPPGEWPGETGLHPWAGRSAWQGNGVLMLQRPREADAIWIFWHGSGREFHGWYVNFQQPFRRTADGYDTQDLELDIWAPVDGPWEWKDDGVLEQRIEEGRFTPEQVAAGRVEGWRVADLLDAGERWWDDAWAGWRPPAGWDRPASSV
ncbi:MAG: DUF402 domain-containing protein [Gaiellaceae bacterium]